MRQTVTNTQAKPQADVRVENHGTVFMFTPLSDAGRDWIDRNVESDGWQWLGRNLVTDWRAGDALANEMVLAGLEVQQ